MGVPCRPAVTQAVVGAGHWAARRRRRALAAWVGAAGLGLVAWGLGAEAPTRAEADKNMEQQKELLRKVSAQVPATAGTQTGISQGSLRALDAAPTKATGWPRDMVVCGDAVVTQFSNIKILKTANGLLSSEQTCYYGDM